MRRGFWGGLRMAGRRTMTSLGALALAAGLAQAGAAAAQDHAPRPATTYKAPRAPDGHPNLQGVWTNASLTRLERNPRYGKGLMLTDEEAAKVEHRNAAVLA